MPRQSILLLSRRSGWADRVLEWTDAFDAHPCESAEEARALLTGSRPWTAILIDGGEPASDRDLIAYAARAGTRPVVVDAPHVSVDWLALGAHTALRPQFSRDDLIAALAAVNAAPLETQRVEHPLVCVTGPGGTGASTIAIAISQGLADQSRDVLLADLRRNAELHVLHHLDADRPGIGDLAEAHRTSAPSPVQLRELSAAVPRGYRVLPGLRRAVGWSSLRPRSLDATLRGLRNAYDVVVCDIDADLEGEAEGGSFDVEERNALSRTAVANAAGVVVVGGPGAKGAHSLLRVLGEVWSHGVPAEQTVAVINRGDRRSLDRLGAALDNLGAREARTLLLPELPLEPLLLSDSRLPDALVGPVTELVVTFDAVPPPPIPERIVPGSLGVAKGGAGEV